MRLARAICVVALFPLLPQISTPASRADPSGSGDGLELVQSELDHLKARDVTITLRFVDLQPKRVFETIAQAAGFRVEFDGVFPASVTVSLDRGTTTVRNLLEDLEPELRITYRVPSPDRLIIVVPAPN